MTNAVTPALVKELRERTGVGMMECKKALVASNGDIEKAIDDLRKSGQAKAVKKGDRIAAEGLVVISLAADNKSAAMVEVNCETDFVAREDQFKKFAGAASQLALQNATEDLTALEQMVIPTSNKTIAAASLELVATLGEKIAPRRIVYLAVTDGVVGAYLHGSADGARIAAMVTINKPDLTLAKDLAMQVAAMKPEYITEQDIPADRLNKEKEIFLAEVQEHNAGKPQEILEKIVAGKIKKFVKEVTLLGQEFVKDPNQTIEQLLKAANATVSKMIRFEVGEGIEKKANTFIEDVMAQVNN